MKTIRESVKAFGLQPGIGRPAKGVEPEYREWIIEFGGGGYVALYRYKADTAVILAVRHQRESGIDVSRESGPTYPCRCLPTNRPRVWPVRRLVISGPFPGLP